MNKESKGKTAAISFEGHPKANLSSKDGRWKWHKYVRIAAHWDGWRVKCVYCGEKAFQFLAEEQ